MKNIFDDKKNDPIYCKIYIQYCLNIALRLIVPHFTVLTNIANSVVCFVFALMNNVFKKRNKQKNIYLVSQLHDFKSLLSIILTVNNKTAIIYGKFSTLYRDTYHKTQT